MKLVVLGINHKTAPVDVREKLSFGEKEIVKANQSLKELSKLKEGLILSTCNRVEIYGVVSADDNDYDKRIKKFLSNFHKIETSDFEDRIYTYDKSDTITHIFNVASGLDSMVVGEVEILGQLKKAYQSAVDGKTTGKVLNRLLQKTFRTAKKVRTDTAITRGSVSVSSVAVKLSQKILGDLSDKKVLVIGAGQMGEQLILYLKENGIKSILVANRTFEKAQTLAAMFDAKAVKFDDFREGLVDADIVITSTGAPHCLIRKDDILEFMPLRKQKPLFLIDLAVPRDVESEVNKVDNVYLYDIDDLQEIVRQNINLRKNELENCQKIIADSCSRFEDWLASDKTWQNER